MDIWEKMQYDDCISELHTTASQIINEHTRDNRLPSGFQYNGRRAKCPFVLNKTTKLAILLAIRVYVFRQCSLMEHRYGRYSLMTLTVHYRYLKKTFQEILIER